MQHMHIAINSLVGRKEEVKYTPFLLYNLS